MVARLFLLTMGFLQLALSQTLEVASIRASQESASRSGVATASCCKIRGPVKLAEPISALGRLEPNVFRWAFRSTWLSAP